MIYLDIALNKIKNEFCNDQSKFIMIDGVNIHYRREGNGEPLLLLHGTGSSLHAWEEWKLVLCDKYEVISIDLPGFGVTGPHPDRDYTISTYLTLIKNFLDQLEILKCHVGGNSFGGLIAWNLASSLPNRVNKLVLVNSSGYDGGSQLPVIKLARKPILGQLLKLLSPKSIVRKNLLFSVYDPGLITGDMINRYHKLVRSSGNRQGLIDRSKTDYPEKVLDIRKISAPTLIVWGKHDQVNPVSMGKRFQADIKHSKLIVYKECGHLTMEEIPERSVKDVIEFLSYINL
jgi:pimeloyl-ACP methyl ester carboxylesterase